jgi:Epidermal patterning factor proteins
MNDNYPSFTLFHLFLLRSFYFILFSPSFQGFCCIYFKVEIILIFSDHFYVYINYATSNFDQTVLIIYDYFIPVSATLGQYLVQERGKSSTHQVQTVSQRQLIGSAPPSCRARCGQCHPCQPVQVAIQPGMAVPMEYYPIVWRCQCGNKLYLP